MAEDAVVLAPVGDRDDADAAIRFVVLFTRVFEDGLDAFSQWRELLAVDARINPFQQYLRGQQRVQFGCVEPQAGQFVRVGAVVCVVIPPAARS